MAENGRQYGGYTPSRMHENGVSEGLRGNLSMDEARQMLDTVQTRVTEFVREKPLAAMGIALFAGYLVAKLVRR